MTFLDAKLYWLWVQRVFGYSAWISDPLRYFGGVESLYRATENDYRASEIFGKTRSFSKSRLVLLNDKDLSQSQALLDLCATQGIEVLTPADEAYPKSLLRLPNYPAVLFVKGDVSVLNGHLNLAVIGSRTPTDYARSAAESITRGLASQGAVIVSGGALGIDSVAHRTALENDQKTILVMGCGILCNYLTENQPLREAVSLNGALISEYPPFSKPSAGSFPQRNRIISGISDGILIVEAGARSGTLNTATHAKQQNRPLFVVPGAVSSKTFEGSNRLLREGAKPAFSAEDILSYFDVIYELRDPKEAGAEDSLFTSEPVLQGNSSAEQTSAAPKKTRKPKVDEDFEQKPKEAGKIDLEMLRSKLSKNAFMVYQNIIEGKNQIDEIVLSVALPTAKVLSALTELELLGVVCKGEGNYYTVNETEVLF